MFFFHVAYYTNYLSYEHNSVRFRTYNLIYFKEVLNFLYDYEIRGWGSIFLFISVDYDSNASKTINLFLMTNYT